MGGSHRPKRENWTLPPTRFFAQNSQGPESRLTFFLFWGLFLQ